MDLDINEEFSQALDELKKSHHHLFITGKAGTGKSTLLEYFRDSSKQELVVLAPTGVAALNVHGQTIHSFFGFPHQITPEQARQDHPQNKLKSTIKKLEMVIIDEASMLRADLLDCIDITLRQYGDKEKAFGGIRMVLIGDLLQLPPVISREEKQFYFENYASPYFFDAKVFDETTLQIIELKKIYRQNEEVFIKILNSIRDDSIDEEQLEKINERYNFEYKAYQKENEVTLCTTNASVNFINNEQLKKLSGKIISFTGNTKGQFPGQLPTDKKLQLKKGAQIMLLNNDQAKRWVNGSMGIIRDSEWDEKNECDILLITLSNGKHVEITPFTWEANQYYYDNKTNHIEKECVGSFTQYPIRLAWAITIHKSQGKTFDNVVVDIGEGTFAHGQLYVALSRCTTLDGLVIRKKIQKKHIWSDIPIIHFMKSKGIGDENELSNSDSPKTLTHRNLTIEEKKNRIENAIDMENNLDLEYLKGNGELIQKTIRPVWIGEMEYEGNEYMGVEALSLENGQSMILSLKRIVGLKNT